MSITNPSKADAYARSLDILEQVRARSGNIQLPLPQICVVGFQSTGKSSLLGTLVDNLAEVLPTGTKTVTVMPLVVHLKKAARASVTVEGITFPWDQAGRRLARKRIGKFQRVGDFRKGTDTYASIDLDEEEDLGVLALSDSSSNSTVGIQPKEQVQIQVCHPDVSDLVIVDLPGIVEIDPLQKTRVEEMIMKRISKPECLIIIVRKADDDAETVVATRLAKKVDPDGKRTLCVITKCDVISEVKIKQDLANEVQSNKYNPLGTHLVCCKNHGEAWDSETGEDDFFAQHAYFSKLQNVRSKMLSHQRLPQLLAALIAQSVPCLRAEIMKKKTQAIRILHDFGGTEMKSQIEIRRELQRYLLSSEVSINQHATSIVDTAAAELKSLGSELTFEWVTGRLIFDSFSPKIFQGKEGFEYCVKEIVQTWWLPIIEHAMNENVVVMLKNHVIGLDSFPYKSASLIHAYKRFWNVKEDEIVATMSKRVSEEIERCSKYGTTADLNVDQNKFLATVIIEEVRKKLAPVLVPVPNGGAGREKNADGNGYRQGGFWNEAVNSRIGVPLTNDQFVGKLQSVLNDLQSCGGLLDPVECQRRLVFNMLTLYYSTMLTQCTTNLHSLIRDVALKGWRDFIDVALGNDPIFLESCVEDLERTRKRKDAKELRDSMIACDRLLDEL